MEFEFYEPDQRAYWHNDLIYTSVCTRIVIGRFPNWYDPWQHSLGQWEIDDLKLKKKKKQKQNKYYSATYNGKGSMLTNRPYCQAALK